jgi:hypothetical protein
MKETEARENEMKETEARENEMRESAADCSDPCA